MAGKDLNALFLDTLKDIYYANKSLPKMAKEATSDKLRAAFEEHNEETEGPIERLEQIFEMLGKPARGKKCDAIEGILDEGKEIMESTPTLPPSMPACSRAGRRAQRNSAPRHAQDVSRQVTDAVKLLDETLKEKKKNDNTLSSIAVSLSTLKQREGKRNDAYTRHRRLSRVQHPVPASG